MGFTPTHKEVPRGVCVQVDTLRVLIAGTLLAFAVAAVAADPPAGTHGDSMDSPLTAGQLLGTPKHHRPDFIDCPSAGTAPLSHLAHSSTARGLRARVPVNRPFSVATFNTEWLFDGVDDPHTPRQDPQAAQEHVDAVAGAVAAVGADLTNLVEVEGCFMLHRLLASSSLQEAHLSPFLVQSSESYHRQQIGILSNVLPLMDITRSDRRVRWPMDGSRCGFWTPKPLTERGRSGASKHWYTVIGLDRPVNGSDEILIVGVHLKAGPHHAASCAKREAQATVVRGIINSYGLHHSPPRHVIVMGDFNDFDGGVPDASGSSPWSSVLDSFHALGLENVLAMVPQSSRYTWEDRNSLHPKHPKSVLDHIFVSPALMQKVTEVRIHHDIRVSDHYPLSVKFALGQDSPLPVVSGQTVADSTFGVVAPEVSPEEPSIPGEVPPSRAQSDVPEDLQEDPLDWLFGVAWTFAAGLALRQLVKMCRHND